MLTGLFCSDVKYKNIFSLKKGKREGVICFHLQLTYYVYAKRKHATPAFIK